MGFFDMGIFEILIILVVILIVVGPDKLPGYARKFGQILRNFRKITSNLTSELTKAAGLEEEAEGAKKTTAEIKASLASEVDEIKQSLDTEAKEIAETIEAEAKGAKR